MGFAPTVLSADENEVFRWVGRLGIRGLFDGEHYFVLTEEDGRTTLRHSEAFTGVLAYPLFAMIGNSTREGFEDMNRALKERGETQG